MYQSTKMSSNESNKEQFGNAPLKEIIGWQTQWIMNENDDQQIKAS